MKRFLALIILLGLVYGGWLFYRESRAIGHSPSLSNLPTSLSLNLGNAPSSWDNLESVLGASINHAVETGKDWVNEATSGQAEPIANRAIDNFQTELKQLPAEQVDKIKYDFCKPIVTDYESKVKP